MEGMITTTSFRRGFPLVILVVAAIITEISGNFVPRNTQLRCSVIPKKSLLRHQMPVISSSCCDSTATKDESNHSHCCSVTTSLRGGGVDTSALVNQAYGWGTNLGAPAALVAGAVIATLYENMSSGSLDIEKHDKPWVNIAKKTTRLLLLSAFISQIVCIFCTTILGTHLLSQPLLETSATTALEYLRENYEFEYLTSRISFTQGLLTWLAAIALEHAIPQNLHENEARRRMDLLVASSLVTLIFAMLSFYNGHVTFYKNYFYMICRYGRVIWIRYVWTWPPRPLTILAIPPFVTSVIYFFKVFLDVKGEDKKANI